MDDHIYIAIGSNLGDRTRTLDHAINDINALPSTSVLARSSIIETDPVGEIPQDDYLNGVIRISTTIEPEPLLNALLEIERNHGRDRTQEQRWGPRTLDLDLIIYNDRIINTPHLQVPHPRLHERGFVLIPLAEISPDLVLPIHKKTPRELLETLER